LKTGRENFYKAENIPAFSESFRAAEAALNDFRDR
jgi:hypothetical protein